MLLQCLVLSSITERSLAGQVGDFLRHLKTVHIGHMDIQKNQPKGLPFGLHFGGVDGVEMGS